MFQSDVADREELPRHERNQQKEGDVCKKKDVQVTTDVIKSVITGKLAKGSLAKRWSAIKAIGFGVNAVLEEKPDVRDGRQRSSSSWIESLSDAETVDVIGGSQSFDYDGEMEEQITTKTKSEDEQFKEMID